MHEAIEPIYSLLSRDQLSTAAGQQKFIIQLSKLSEFVSGLETELKQIKNDLEQFSDSETIQKELKTKIKSLEQEVASLKKELKATSSALTRERNKSKTETE